MAREWPITLSAAAERLNCSNSTVGMVVALSEIPVRRLGNSKCLDAAGYARLAAELRKLPGALGRKKPRRVATTSA